MGLSLLLFPRVACYKIAMAVLRSEENNCRYVGLHGFAWSVAVKCSVLQLGAYACRYMPICYGQESFPSVCLSYANV